MSDSRPNLVLLVLDTQRADRLSCYGYAAETSPHLDELAAGGARFERAISPAQWTAPAHASLFTGLYPSQHTVYQMDAALPAEVLTLAERLQQAGYRTDGFSHNPLVGVAKNGLTRGFDRFSSHDYLGAGLLSFHLSQPTGRGGLAARLRRRARFFGAELLGYSQQTGLGRFAPLARPLWRAGLRLTGGAKTASSRRTLAAAAGLLADGAGALPRQPRFVFINLMGTHVPYDLPRWAARQHMARWLGRQSAEALLQKANNWQVDVANWLAMEPAEEGQRAILEACYDAAVAAQDAQVGWFLERLKNDGSLDRTVLVVAADHGDHLGDKQRVNHIFGVYNALTHVPLLVRDPRGALATGSAVERPVSTRRIFHTLLEAAGAAAADEQPWSLTRAGERNEEAAVLAEGMPLQWAIERIEKRRPGLVAGHGYDQPARAVCAMGYKLIITGARRELYAAADMAEEHDLSGERPEVALALEEEMARLVAANQPAGERAQWQQEDAAVLAHLRRLGYVE